MQLRQSGLDDPLRRDYYSTLTTPPKKRSAPICYSCSSLSKATSSNAARSTTEVIPNLVFTSRSVTPFQSIRITLA